jgi:hypothetical protein
VKTGGREEQELLSLATLTEEEVMKIEWRTLLDLLGRDKLKDYHISIAEGE